MRVLLHSKSQIVADVPSFVRESDIEIADADLSAEEAGRLCYLSGHRPNPKTATNGRYLLNICAQRHYSVLGHASASIYVETSRNTTHEIIRSRWFTFSEVSQRYVDAGEFEFQQHPGLAGLGDMSDYIHAEYIQPAVYEARKAYEHIAGTLEDEGIKRKEARQAARGILPGGTWTGILISGNLRAWRDFLAQRLAPGADLEIQGVAREIYKILKIEFPNSFQDFDSYGMITHERLIQRVLERHDKALHLSHGSAIRIARKFVEDVREIQDKGLWVLADDPWEEDKA